MRLMLDYHYKKSINLSLNLILITTSFSLKHLCRTKSLYKRQMKYWKGCMCINLKIWKWDNVLIWKWRKVNRLFGLWIASRFCIASRFWIASRFIWRIWSYKKLYGFNRLKFSAKAIYVVLISCPLDESIGNSGWSQL